MSKSQTDPNSSTRADATRTGAESLTPMYSEKLDLVQPNQLLNPKRRPELTGASHSVMHASAAWWIPVKMMI